LPVAWGSARSGFGDAFRIAFAALSIDGATQRANHFQWPRHGSERVGGSLQENQRFGKDWFGST
jgi:hypothetical protein